MSRAVTCNNNHCFLPTPLTVTKALLFRLCSIKTKDHELRMIMPVLHGLTQQGLFVFSWRNTEVKYCTTCSLLSCLNLQRLAIRNKIVILLLGPTTMFTLHGLHLLISAFVFYIHFSTGLHSSCTLRDRLQLSLRKRKTLLLNLLLPPLQ